MALPRFVMIRATRNKTYLSYVNEDVQTHGFMRTAGERNVTPYTKMEVVKAKTGDGLVHLRCSYDNKYWVRQSPNSWYIVAGADEAVEDQSLWTCTLFKLERVAGGDDITVRFLHVQLGHYVRLKSSTARSITNCLFAGSEKPDSESSDVFTLIDLQSGLVLPKNIGFKGYNGKYLSAQWTEGYQYLQFSGSDSGEQRVWNQVYPISDGNVCIKSIFYGKYWRRSPNWIWGDSTDGTGSNKDTLFKPVKVTDTQVALRNLGNNYYCKSLTTEGKTDCLNAGTPTITNEARLEVVELVLSRQIYNVVFSLLDARIYNETPLVMSTGVASNNTTTPQENEVKLSYTETRSSTWNSSVSLKLGVTTTITSGVPLIAEGSVEIGFEFSGTYEWGATEESTTSIDTVYKVTVPPKTKVTVSLIATRASCDVPFTYTQKDTLIDGEEVTYQMDDGLYTGINSYNFRYDTKEEPL